MGFSLPRPADGSGSFEAGPLPAIQVRQLETWQVRGDILSQILPQAFGFSYPSPFATCATGAGVRNLYDNARTIKEVRLAGDPICKPLQGDNG